MPPTVADGGAICVVNAGAWGTALAVLLARGGRSVALWARRDAAATQLRQTRENRAYLPGVTLPPSLEVTSDLSSALRGRRIVIVAAVSDHLRRNGAIVGAAGRSLGAGPARNERFPGRHASALFGGPRGGARPTLREPRGGPLGANPR